MHFFTSGSLVEIDKSAGSSLRGLTSNEVSGFANMSHLDLTLEAKGILNLKIILQNI